MRNIKKKKKTCLTQKKEKNALQEQFYTAIIRILYDKAFIVNPKIYLPKNIYLL